MSAARAASGLWSDDSSFYRSEVTSNQGLATSTDAEAYDEWQRRLDELRAMKSLDDDWDGQGACPPHPDLIDNVVEFLENTRQRQPRSAPHRCVASPTGSIVLEWQDGDFYMEAEIDEPFHLEWMVEFGNSPVQHSKTTWGYHPTYGFIMTGSQASDR